MLTADEILAVRRHAGYPATPAADDPVAPAVAALSAEAEGVLRTLYLPALDRLEGGIVASDELVGHAEAAVWKRNPHELLERTMLYRAQRLALCAFLGVAPGAGIAAMLIIPPIDGATCPPDCSGGVIGPGTGPDADYPPVVYVV